MIKSGSTYLCILVQTSQLHTLFPVSLTSLGLLYFETALLMLQSVGDKRFTEEDCEVQRGNIMLASENFCHSSVACLFSWAQWLHKSTGI